MNQITKITPWVTLVGAVMIGGCLNSTPKTADSSALHNDVTDIRPMESSTPPIPQPVAYTAAAPDPAPVAVSSTPAAAGNTHVVKRGETLYGIAKQTYGSGKEWQKIAMANPGVTPTTLKVGQTLVIP
jgi:nucleoid-associated protein YgaU